MRATSIGHAGILDRDRARSIVCDPWFVPAFFGSWFVFPRNDQLDDDLLAAHRGRRLPLRLAPPRRPPGRAVAARAPPTRHRRCSCPATRPASSTADARPRLHELVRTVDGERARPRRARPSRSTSRPRSPTGRAATRRSSSATARPASSTRTTAAPTDLDALAATARSTCTGCSTAGRSGTRWSTRCDAGGAAPLVRAKVESQLARAMRYVEAVGARAVVPSAGPPCFLDPELFHLNVITGDELSIFLDQRVVPRAPRRRPGTRRPRVPGTTIDVDAEAIAVPTRSPTTRRWRSSTDKARVPRRVPGRLGPWLGELKAGWDGTADLDLVGRAAGVVGAAAGDGADAARGHRRGLLLRAGGRRRRHLIDFPAGEVRAYAGEPYALPLRDRPRARRDGRRRASRRLEQLAVPVVPLPGLARRRVQRVRLQLLQVAVGGADAPHRGRGAAASCDPPTETEPTSSSASYVVQRRCPHRNADLARVR